MCACVCVCVCVCVCLRVCAHTDQAGSTHHRMPSCPRVRSDCYRSSITLLARMRRHAIPTARQLCSTPQARRCQKEVMELKSTHPSVREAAFGYRDTWDLFLGGQRGQQNYLSLKAPPPDLMVAIFQSIVLSQEIETESPQRDRIAIHHNAYQTKTRASRIALRQGY